MPHRSAAGPLAWAWVVLVVYASLHPFEGWTWPASADIALLWLPWPAYWSTFDIVSNLLGYLPLGFLICTAQLRGGRAPRGAAWRTVLAGCALSLAMEWLQILLPVRVPSRADWLLNSAGTLLGTLAACVAGHYGWFDAWQRLRDRWITRQGGPGLALLLLWPAALLAPPPLPLGLGQVMQPLGELLSEGFAGTPLAAWVPAAAAPALPLSPGSELVATALGLLAPCFVAFAASPPGPRRVVMLSGALLLGVGMTTLAAALNYGPDHALAWVAPATLPALVAAVLLGVGMSWLAPRWAASVGLLALAMHVFLVNLAGPDPYVASSLQAWEQGRFIRFHGVSQWLAWVWPYAALAHLLRRLARRDEA